MAVGVIIGAVFKAIVDSLVSDVVMPFIGIFIYTSSFADIAIHVGNANIPIGKFISAITNFLIIAFVIFCMVKMINKAHEKLKKKEEDDAATEPSKGPTTEEELHQEDSSQNEQLKDEQVNTLDSSN